MIDPEDTNCTNSPPAYSPAGDDPTRGVDPQPTEVSPSQHSTMESGAKNPINGWPTLAKLITDNPGFEAFPSFKDLNIKMLLYYQAELDDLRTKLDAQELKDYRRQNPNGRPDKSLLHFNRNVEHLLISGSKVSDDDDDDDDDKEERKQYDLVIQIRNVMEKYSLSPIVTHNMFY